MSGPIARVDALILAGGRSSRMRGSDKPSAVVDGVALVDRVLGAASFCDTVIVVGPERPDTQSSESATTVLHTREEPPYGGPVRAIAAGIAARDGVAAPADARDVVLVLSADLPYVTETELGRLVEALHQREDVDAVFGLDSAGRVQYLVGAWRRAALERGVADAAAPYSAADRRGPSIRDALPSAILTMPLVGIDDVDTPDELDAVRAAPHRPTVEHARFLLGRRLHSLEPTAAVLADHLGGTLAESLFAATPFPTFATSAMDGYAVGGTGPWTLDESVIVAGSADRVTVASGHAIRIATGAAVPDNATVVRDEFVSVDESGLLRLRQDAPVRDDTRRVAEDWAAGEQLAPKGTTVTPAVVSAALSAGVDHGSVRRAPTVRLVLTGDEIGTDAIPAHGRIRDTIGPVMPTYLQWCGFTVTEVVQCADTEEAFDDAIHGVRASTPDVVVIIGATGRGAADRLAGALHRASARTVVGGLACRPGGSTSVSVLPDSRVVFGVPGNPYAAVSTVCLLGPAIAHALSGRSAPPPTTGILADSAVPLPESDVARVLPGRYLGNGMWQCDTVIRTAHLAALIGRDALMLITPESSPGGPVEVVPLPRR
ncbi:MAG: NTP transferase domain-containing protein [Rhodococcus sp. (in: high G+C Gram-positive bacteria)]